jgi:hypothetical protein
MELKTLFSRRDGQLRHFFYRTEIITHPLFPDPNNGAAFVTDSETSLDGFKMADRTGGAWCTSKICSNLNLYHPFIFTPDTGTVSEPIPGTNPSGLL